MKTATLALLFLTLYSCIPTRIAPKIETHKIVETKKFSKELPQGYGFAFEDPKDANEFYSYVNSKYDLAYTEVEYNVPFELDGEKLYLSFYECERTTKTLNLIPILVDAKLENDGSTPLLEDLHTSRSGQWYIIITVRDVTLKDVLNEDHKQHVALKEYLESLRQEYLATHHYNELNLRAGSQ